MHNAAAGYWSLAHDTHAPSTSLCAGTASFSAGLLEACAQVGCEHRAVLLIAYDIPYPEPLSGLWNVPEPFAAAFVLAQAGEGHRIEVGIGAAATDGADHWPGGLPRTLQANPAAACAPLLALLAGASAGEVFLPYLDRCSVRVTLCR